MDAYFKIRQKFAKVLGKDPIFAGLAIKIGGSTSFDIYPHGWDKTYPLNGNSTTSQLEGYELFFVGDKCAPGGNDHEIFVHVRDLNQDNAFETHGPARTLHIIDTLLKR
jgi:phosphomannomutase